MNWRWRMTGTEDAHGSLDRQVEEEGVIEDELMGDALMTLLHHDWPEVFDYDQHITIDIWPDDDD